MPEYNPPGGGSGSNPFGAAIDLSEMQTISEDRVVGRASGGGSGIPQELTASQARDVLRLGTSAVLDTGTGSGNIVVLDGTGLPAVDGSQLTGVTASEVNDLTAAVTWANVPDANITQSSVVQHSGALSIAESQIADLGSYLTSSGNLSEVNSASTSRTNLGLGSADTVSFAKLGLNVTTPDATIDIECAATTDIGLIVNGATSQSADLQRWQVNGSDKSIVDENGYISINGTNTHRPLVVSETNYPASFDANSSSTSTMQAGIMIANLNTTTNNRAGVFFAKDTAGNVVAAIEGKFVDRTNNYGDVCIVTRDAAYGAYERMNIFSDGRVSVHRNAAGAMFDVLTNTATYVGLSLQGITGQTANLQEWKNPAGSLICRIGPSGEMVIPNSTTFTPAETGEIGLDTSVTDFSHGILKYYGGEEMAVVAMPIAELTSPTDTHVVTYNATNDEFELAAAGGGGYTPSVTVKDSTSSSVTYTLTADDDHLIARIPGSNDINLTLPTASGIGGKRYTIVVDQGGMGFCYLDTNGSEEINSSSSQLSASTDGDMIEIFSDGDNWWIINKVGFS